MEKQRQKLPQDNPIAKNPDPGTLFTAAQNSSQPLNAEQKTVSSYTQQKFDPYQVIDSSLEALETDTSEVNSLSQPANRSDFATFSEPPPLPRRSIKIPLLVTGISLLVVGLITAAGVYITKRTGHLRQSAAQSTAEQSVDTKLLPALNQSIIDAQGDEQLLVRGDGSFSGNVKASGVQATTLKVTDAQTTNLQATTLKATDIQATTLKATDAQTTNLQATTLKATDIQANTVQTGNLRANDVQTNSVRTTDVQATGNLTVSGAATFGSISIGNTSSAFALDVSGDINASNSLKIAGKTICTVQGCITTSGVTSVNALSGAVVLQGSASQITVSTSGGTITLAIPQNIATSSSPTFAGLNLQSAGGLPGSLTTDSTGISFTVGGRTFILPTTGGANQTICTTGVSCAAGGGQALLLAPGSAQTDNTADASIFVNDTGGGNLIQIQRNGVNRFVVDNNGNVTFGGTSSSTLVPNSDLTVGTGSYQLALQGNQSSVISSTDSNSNTSTQIRFNFGSGAFAPTGNVIYQFPNDSSISPGTYTVCTTAGNCVGQGGSATVSGTGNAGFLPLFTNDTNLIKSIVSQSGAALTVTGSQTISGGLTVQSGDVTLSTGNLLVSSGTLSVNGTSSFANTLTVTSGGLVITGNSSIAGNLTGLTGLTSSGTITFSSISTGAAYINTGQLTSEPQLSVSRGGTGAASFTANGVLYGNGSGAIQSTAAGSAGSCLISNGSVLAPSFAGCASGVTLQAVYNNSVPAVVDLNATSGGLVLRDSSGGIGGSLFAIQNSGGTSTYLSVSATGTTVDGTFTSSGALTVQSGGLSVTGGNITIGSGSLNISSGNAAITGNLSATGSVTLSGLSTNGPVYTTSGGLLNTEEQLSVVRGGTGAATFTANGVLVGNGTGAIISTATGTAGQCLISNGAGSSPNFSSCAGGVTLQAIYNNSNPAVVTLDDTNDGVIIRDAATPIGSTLFAIQSNDGNTSYLSVDASGVAIDGGLNTSGSITVQSGGLTVSAGGLTVTGDSTINGELSGLTGLSSSGTIIFSDLSTDGLVNVTGGQLGSQTVVTIAQGGTNATTAADARTNLSAAQSGANADITSTANLNTITPSGALTIGAIGQAFTLQGTSGSLITGSSGGNTTSLGFAAPTANRTITLPDASGTLAVSASGNIALSAAGNVTFTGILPIANGGTNAFDAATARSNLGAAQSGTNADITTTTALNTITPSGSLTIGSIGQQFTLQGNATSTITSTQSGNTATLGFTGTATGNVIYNFDRAASAGTYTVCTTAGNCTGGVTSLNGLTGALTLANSSGSGSTVTIDDAIADSSTKGIATFSSINFTGTGTIDLIQDITTGSSPTFAALNLTGSTTLSLGTASTNTGDVTFYNSGSAFNVSLQSAAPTANRTITLPDASGTLAVSASGNIALSAAGNVTFTGILPIANGGTNAFDAATARSNLGAAQSGTNADITTTTALNTITPSGSLTIGSIGQQFTLQGNATSTITSTQSGNTATLGFTGTATGNVIYNFDRAASAGTYTVCTTAGNCTGGSSVTSVNGISGGIIINNASALDATHIAIDDASTSVKGIAQFEVANFTTLNGLVDLVQDINTSATPTFTGLNLTGTNSLLLGTASSDDGSITFYNDSSNFSVVLQATTASADRTIILPNESGTICIQGSSNCGFATTANAFVQGGNTFGATAVLGTNDNFGLSLRTNSTTVASFSATGAALFKNASNSTAALQIQDNSSAVLLNVDSTNSRVAIGPNSSIAQLYVSGATGTEATLRVNSTTSNVILDVQNNGSTIFSVDTAGFVGVRTDASFTIEDASGGDFFEFNIGNQQFTATSNTVNPTLDIANEGGEAITALTNSASNYAISASGQGGGIETFSTNLPGVKGSASNSISGLFQTTNTAGTNANPTLVARANTSQTANLFEAQNSSSVAVFSVSTTGALITTAGTTGLSVTGAPTNSATSSLIRIGNAITGGDTTANGGTYIGLNAPAAGAGSAADLLNLQVNGSSRLRVTTSGATTVAGQLTVSSGGLTVTGNSTITGTLGSLTGLTSSGTITFSGLSTNGPVTVSGGVLGSASSLGVGQGGTGGTSFTANGVLYGNGTGALGVTGTGSTGQCLVSAGGGSAPSFGSCAQGVNSGVTLQNAYGNSTSPQIVLSGAQGGILVRDNATPIGATLFGVQSNGGSNYLSVSASNVAVGVTSSFANTLTVTSGGLAVNTAGITVSGNSTIAGTLSSLTGVVLISGTVTVSSLSTGAAYIDGTNKLQSEPQLAISRGGTNVSSFTNTNGLVYYDGSKLNSISEGASETCLVGSTGAPPVFGTCGAGVTLQQVYNNSTTQPQIVLNSSPGASGLIIRDNVAPLGGNLFAIQNNAGSTSYLAVTSGGIAVAGTASATDAIQSLLFDTASAVALNVGTTNATQINLNKHTVLAANTNLSFTAGNGNFDQSATSGTFKTGTGAVTLNGNTTVANNKSFTAGGDATFVDATNSPTAFRIQNAGGASTIFNVDTTNSIITVKGASSNAVVSLTELFTSGVCTGTNWTGTGPWTHTIGSAVPLSCTPPATVTSGATYQVKFTIGGAPITSSQTITPNLGGVSGKAIYGIAGNITDYTVLITTSSTAGLSFTPTTDWNGTISAISVKEVTASNAVLKVNNSDSTTGLEVRGGGIASGVTTANTFVGLNSGLSLVSGTQNAGFGAGTLQYNTSGGQNSALGFNALQSNTTGSNNTGLGFQSLQSNINGAANTAVGYNSLLNNVTGSNNSAFGQQALLANTAGSNNTAVGSLALSANTLGSNNIAIGSSALAGNTQGGSNVAVGGSALGAITTNSNGTALGYQALQAATGAGNLGVGTAAGKSITSGANNSFLGYNAGNTDSIFATLANINNSGAFGYNAQVQASNSITIGGQGSNQVNVGIGTTVPLNVFSVSPIQYSTGTVSQSSSTTVVGVGTTFTSAMVGNQLIYADGVSDTITGYTSPTNITVTTNRTHSSSAYRIHYIGLQVKSDGSVGIGAVDPQGFQVQSSVSESTRGYTNIRMGVAGALGTPTARIILEHGTSPNLWEIDNDTGNFRIYQPNNIQLQLGGSSLTVGVVNSSFYVNTTNNRAAIGTTTTGTSRLTVTNGATADSLLDLKANTTSVVTVGSAGATNFQNSTNSANAFRIQNAGATSLFNIDSTADSINLITNGNFEIDLTGWTDKDSLGDNASISHNTGIGYFGGKSLTIISAGTDAGTKYNVTLITSTAYTLTFYATSGFGPTTDLKAGYSNTGTLGGEANTSCYLTLPSTKEASTNINGWNRYSCTFTTPGSNSGTPYIYVEGSGIMVIDAAKLQLGSNPPVFRDGAIDLNSVVTSPLSLQNSSNSVSAFIVQNSTGSPVLSVDTLNNRIGINTGITANTLPTADLSFGAGANRTINVVAQTTLNTAGNSLTVVSADGNGSGTGGDLNLQSGNGTGGTNGAAGGHLSVQGGVGTTITGGTQITSLSAGGGVTIKGGASGNAVATSGTAAWALASGGGVIVQGGAGGFGSGGTSSNIGASGGGVTIQGGTGGLATGSGLNVAGVGGNISLQAGTGGLASAGSVNTFGNGGTITIQGGTAGGGNANGGNVSIVGGIASGTGTAGKVIIKPGTGNDSTTALQIQNAAGTTFFNADSTKQRIGIGTSAPIAQLHVAGLDIPTQAGTVNMGGTTAVYVQGRYAYIVQKNADLFQIVDVSNPASPVIVSTTTTALGLTSGTSSSVYVQGNYAYITVGNGGNKIHVVDVTNPREPRFANGTGGLTITNCDASDTVAQGRYLFVACTSNSTLRTFDISNPASPTLISTFTTLNAPNAIAVQGRFVYLGEAQDTIEIVDVGNVASPKQVGATDDGIAAAINSVAIQGRYLYAGSTSAGHTMYVIDVGNVAKPMVLSTNVNITAGTSPGFTKIVTQDRYMYATSDNGILYNFNISDPTNISLICTAGSTCPTVATDSAADMMINGRYAYIADNDNITGKLTVMDLGGAYIQQLEVGGLEVATIQTSGDTSINGSANIGGDLTVGSSLQAAVLSVGGLPTTTYYSTGTACQSSSSCTGTGNSMTVGGSGTSFTSAMIGGRISFTYSTGTVTQSGTTVTSVVGSGATFTAAMVGAQMYINGKVSRTVIGFINSSVLTVSVSETIGAVTTYSITGMTQTITAVASGTSLTTSKSQALPTSGQGCGCSYVISYVAGGGGGLYVNQDGKVGIGTNAPTATLQVFTGTNVTNALLVQNAASQTIFNVDTSLGKVSIGLGSASAGSAALCSTLTNNAAPAAGTAYLISDCSGTPSADFAEMYPAASDTSVGDVVAQGSTQVPTYNSLPDGSVDWDSVKGTVSQVVKATTPYSSGLIGVMSDNYGDFGSVGYNIKETDNPKSVALVGRVLVKVTTENGAIEPGDFLTASATLPGYAMKATQAGNVIGQALASYSDGVPGTVMVFVRGQHYAGPAISDAIQNGGAASLASIAVTGSANLNDLNVSGNASLVSLTVSGTATVGTLVVTGPASVGTLTVNGHIITAGDDATVAAGAASCTAPTVTITGNDTAGTITIDTGTGCSATGALAKITFANTYGVAPKMVITPTNASATDLKYFIGSTTSNEFTVNTSTIPSANTTYKFNYFGVQ